MDRDPDCSEMDKSEGESVTVKDTSKLIKDFSELYLNEKFSDITLIVDKERICAHKVILAARSTYFEALLYNEGKEIDQSELQLSLDVTPDCFRNILEFLYTGTITISALNINPILSLAEQCSLTDLTNVVVTKIKTNLNLKNICSVLNTANLYDLKELQDACHSFMDENSSKILANDGFKDLTQKSLINLLERDTFFAPEIEIFKRVAQWCQANNDVGDMVVKCVRLSWLSVVEIVSTVWPTKLVGCEDLLQAISEIVDVKPRSEKCRGRLLKDVNVATPENNATVITGTKTTLLLTGNRNVDSYAETTVGEKNGITVKLGFPVFINHIHMMLWDKDLRSYRYYIEMSLDQKTWKKVIDYDLYSCRSVQKLYFETEIVQYVRVVGTFNSSHPGFHLVFFEAYFKESVPRIVNNIVCPNLNVATAEKKAVVIEGTEGGALLDGVTTNYGRYTSHLIGKGSIVVQLAQPFMLSSMKMLLWDEDNRSYKYYVETSVNESGWTIVVDHRNEERKSWQVIRFSEKSVVYIRITGTSNTANKRFHLMHFECPASEDQKNY